MTAAASREQLVQSADVLVQSTAEANKMAARLFGQSVCGTSWLSVVYYRVISGPADFITGPLINDCVPILPRRLPLSLGQNGGERRQRRSVRVGRLGERRRTVLVPLGSVAGR